MRCFCIWLANLVMSVVLVNVLSTCQLVRHESPKTVVLPSIPKELSPLYLPPTPSHPQTACSPLVEPVYDKYRGFYTAEEILLVEEACRENIPAGKEYLWPVVFAIGRAENGGPGREFGILQAEAKTFRQQAGWCAATVARNHERWLNSKSPLGFIEFLGSRYCPIGAGNDPNNLNIHWVRNVRSYWELYK